MDDATKTEKFKQFMIVLWNQRKQIADLERMVAETQRSAAPPAPPTPSPTASTSCSSSTEELRVWDPAFPADGTILDILNADCWRIILDYVSINDVVRSERVSRAWQQVVWEYLPGVHNYRIENLNHYNHMFGKRYWNYHSIKHNGHENLFKEMIQKIGSSLVKIVVNYINESNLRAIVLHCPNLKSLTLFRTYRNLPLDHVKKCEQLKQIAFDSCGLREDYLSEMITSETVEELIINNSIHVSGRFLKSLKKYLKSLGLNRCDYLQFKYLQSAENYLTKLTRLELNKSSPEILENIHLMLDRMPDLEHLSLMEYRTWELYDKVKLPAAIGRLSRLKKVYLMANENVTDEWLASIARGCPALRTVDVGYTSVTGRGLLALCRARPALEELMVAGLDATDADVEACALCCTGLRLLDVETVTQVTKRLPELIARPRARPLLLRLGWMDIEGIHYEGLVLRWNDPIAKYCMDYEYVPPNVDDSDSSSDADDI